MVATRRSSAAAAAPAKAEPLVRPPPRFAPRACVDVQPLERLGTPGDSTSRECSFGQI